MIRGSWLRPGKGFSFSAGPSALSSGVPTVSARSGLVSSGTGLVSSLLSCLFLQMSVFKSPFHHVVGRSAIDLTFLLISLPRNGGVSLPSAGPPEGAQQKLTVFHPGGLGCPAQKDGRLPGGVVPPNQRVPFSFCVPRGNSGGLEIPLSTV